MERLVDSEEVGRACKLARGPCKLDMRPSAAAELRALVPGAVGLSSSSGGSASANFVIDAGLRARLEEEVQACIKQFKRLSGPGSGSRFEHWGTLRHHDGGMRAAGVVVARLLFGEVPQDVLHAFLGGRLLAARKPNGKIRLLACGSVVRRIAAKAACKVFRDELQQFGGPHQ